jgi:hypothetical protein
MLFKYSWKEITMTNPPGSASGDQKPNTPANPQQNQRAGSLRESWRISDVPIGFLYGACCTNMCSMS